MRRVAAGFAALLALLPLPCAAAAVPRRVVSLNPSLTATLVALGAEPMLVGVDDWSAKQQPEVRDLPVVGGLFTPSLEAVVALQPDLVVLVPGAQQRDLGDRLRALGIEVLELPNISLADLLASIERLGERVGRAEVAARRVAEIRAAWDAAARRSAGAARPRAVLVIQREPLFVVGAGSFLDDMLRAAGAQNAAAGFGEAYPRVAVEWLIEAAPEVILDASDDPTEPAAWWARWPSLPAVAAGRVVRVEEAVMLPGPYPDRGLAILSELLGFGTPR
jgi:iron complex transport system substrate-binding protein